MCGNPLHLGVTMTMIRCVYGVCVCVFTLVSLHLELRSWILHSNLFQGWTKGVIFINGRNLGRYWNIGPQETLYLPGPWLHPGSNEVSSPLHLPHPSPLSLAFALQRVRTWISWPTQPPSLQIIVFEEFKPGLEIHFTNISHLGMVFWRVNLQPLRQSFWVFLAELLSPRNLSTSSLPLHDSQVFSYTWHSSTHHLPFPSDLTSSLL